MTICIPRLEILQLAGGEEGMVLSCSRHGRILQTQHKIEKLELLMREWHSHAPSEIQALDSQKQFLEAQEKRLRESCNEYKDEIRILSSSLSFTKQELEKSQKQLKKSEVEHAREMGALRVQLRACEQALIKAIRRKKRQPHQEIEQQSDVPFSIRFGARQFMDRLDLTHPETRLL